MKIQYSKDALKFLAKTQKNISGRLVLAWDPDFSKLTDAERKSLEHAENSGFIPDEDIDWNDLEKYAD